MCNYLCNILCIYYVQDFFCPTHYLSVQHNYITTGVLTICSIYYTTTSSVLLFNLLLYQIAPHGAVACDDERCSQVGVDVMKSGGNAVDAAVSVMFCLSVVQAESSGIGG